MASPRLSAPPALPRRLNWDRIFRMIALLLPLGIVGNLVLTLLTTDRYVLSEIEALPRGLLVVAVVLSMITWVTYPLRMWIWTSFVGYPVRLLEGLRVYLAGFLGSAVTPTASGDGAIKWALLVRRGIPTRTVATLYTIEVVEELIFFLIALPVAALLSTELDAPTLLRRLGQVAVRSGPVLLGVGGGLVLLALAGYVALRGGFGPKVRRVVWRGAARFRRALRDYAHSLRSVARLIAARGKARFAVSMVLTAVQWTARYSVATAVLAFLGVPVRPVLFWVLQWVTFALMNAVPTPGAAGGAEAAFALLYRPFVPSSLLGVATAGWRLFVFYVPLAAAAVGFVLFQVSDRRRARRGGEESAGGR